jgi:hypothetical protein
MGPLLEGLGVDNDVGVFVEAVTITVAVGCTAVTTVVVVM